MATYSGYTFNNMTRIGLDECSSSQENIQDVASCNYMTQNFFASDCSMTKPIELATSQIGVNYKGTQNVAIGGCNINESSKLQIGTINCSPRCRIDLFHRPFATVPYLGRGAVNPVMEAQIQQGEQIVNKRSINNLSEKSYIKYHQTPLLPAVQKRINNPANQIESVASDGWVRGGVPSRELTRDADYFNKHTTYQYA